MSAIFKTQGGSGGFFPSIFVTGLSGTDTVSAAKDGNTVHGKWDSERSGFLISPLHKMGMWTVTASNGVETRTKKVLVDVATEFAFDIDFSKLYLYDEGDECEDITGGWSEVSYWSNWAYGYNTNNDLSELRKKYTTLRCIVTMETLKVNGAFAFGFFEGDTTTFYADNGSLGAVGEEKELVYTFNISKTSNGKAAVCAANGTSGVVGKTREKREDCLYVYRSELNGQNAIGVAVKKVWLE